MAKSLATVIGPTGGTSPKQSQSEAALGLLGALRKRIFSSTKAAGSSVLLSKEKVSLKGDDETKRQS